MAVADVMTEAEMSGYLTEWLAREHVAELRSQAARRQWRADAKRARAEIGRVGEPAARRSSEAAVYCHRAAAPVRQSTSA